LFGSNDSLEYTGTRTSSATALLWYLSSLVCRSVAFLCWRVGSERGAVKTAFEGCTQAPSYVYMARSIINLCFVERTCSVRSNDTTLAVMQSLITSHQLHQGNMSLSFCTLANAETYPCSQSTYRHRIRLVERAPQGTKPSRNVKQATQTDSLLLAEFVDMLEDPF
jgi:hypothetical protein